MELYGEDTLKAMGYSLNASPSPEAVTDNASTAQGETNGSVTMQYPAAFLEWYDGEFSDFYKKSGQAVPSFEEAYERWKDLEYQLWLKSRTGG